MNRIKSLTELLQRLGGPHLITEIGDALVAVWDGVSKGTKNMIDTAHHEGLPVYVLIEPTGQERTNIS